MGTESIPTRPMSWYSGSHDTNTSSFSWRPPASVMASRFEHSTRSGSITPFGSDVEPLVNCRIASRSSSSGGWVYGWPEAARRSSSCTVVGSEGCASRNGASCGSMTRRSVSPCMMRPRVCDTNSSSEPMRIGSGRTMTVAPASHTAWMVVTRSRVVGPRIATWSPMPTPCAWSVAATRVASACSSAQGTVTGSSGPTKVIEPPCWAARTRRSLSVGMASSTPVRRRRLRPIFRVLGGRADRRPRRSRPRTCSLVRPSEHRQLSPEAALPGALEAPYPRGFWGRKSCISRRKRPQKPGVRGSNGRGRPRVGQVPCCPWPTSTPIPRAPNPTSPRTATRPRSRSRSRPVGSSAGRPTAPSTPRTPPVRSPPASSRSPTGPSSTCSTCSPTPAGPASTWATRSATSAPTSLARFKRMTGHNVLHTMGYDAFGLPAEQYAVETGLHPRTTTEANIANMQRQLGRLGLGHDSRRVLATTDVAYYRWTQWIFLQIFNAWYDPEADRARPIAELEAELAAGTREPGEGTNPSGRPVRRPRRGRAPQGRRRAPPGLPPRGARQLVPRPRHGAGQRGGHRRRSLRARQLPGLPAPARAVDAAHHRLRRAAAGRPRPARLARADQADAAQLDRPFHRGQRHLPRAVPRAVAARASRCSPPGPTRSSAPPTWCWPPSTSWWAGSRPRRGPTPPRPSGRPAPPHRPRPWPATPGGQPAQRRRAPGRVP